MWEVNFCKEAVNDFDKLDKSQRLLVQKALTKVRQNPLPDYLGGYGKALGKHNGINLTGCCKIKLVKSGIRIIYRINIDNRQMIVIAIGLREDNRAYIEAASRLLNNR